MSDVTDEMARRALEVLWSEGFTSENEDDSDEKDVESMKKALAEALIVYRDSLPQPAEPSWREKHGLYDG